MPSKLKTITVFCGASPRVNDTFKQYAYNVGKFLAENNIQIIYGGAKVGTMGMVANGALENGGKVIGITPRLLCNEEFIHENLTELIWVDSMYERKLKMETLSDGFISLPGGYGTLDELFEMLMCGQLGLHQKPVALLNIDGFYNSLIAMTDLMMQTNFLKEDYHDMLIVDDNIFGLLSKMKAYEAPPSKKWVHENEVE